HPSPAAADLLVLVLEIDGVKISRTNLKTLFLSYNQVEMLKLITLHLDGNDLSELSADDFEGLAHLRELRLSFNKLQNIHFNTFHPLLNLRSLLLQNNSLDRLTPRLFVRLSKLKVLNLDENKLGHLQPDVFQGLKDLQILSLKFNQLRTLRSETLEPLRKLNVAYLSGNLWDCTSVNKFCSWVTEHRDALGDQPICYSPSSSSVSASSSLSAFSESTQLSQSPLFLQDYCIRRAAGGSSFSPARMLTVLTPPLLTVIYNHL
uniref:LRRCT domain-containing protein n=1 Tax=Kryptolebias marmoratus TaxID=37003 RepID=A0A3Q3GZV1_KRYMA